MSNRKLKEEIVMVNKIEDVPSLQVIQSIPRGLKLKVIFQGDAKLKRAEIGTNWELQLPNFSIGLHTNGREINILISIAALWSKFLTQFRIIFADFYQLMRF